MVKDMVIHQHLCLKRTATFHCRTSCLSLFSQAKTGVVMNILGVLAVSLAMNTWGIAMFDLNTYPEWAHPSNKSALVLDAPLSTVQSLNATR